MTDIGSDVPALLAEVERLERVCRILLRQVKRGGPSNIERVASDYFTEDLLPAFRRICGQP